MKSNERRRNSLTGFSTPLTPFHAVIASMYGVSSAILSSGSMKPPSSMTKAESSTAGSAKHTSKER